MSPELIQMPFFPFSLKYSKTCYHRGNSAQYYVAAWMGGEFEELDVCICMAVLCYSLENITTLLIGYTSI